MLPKRILPAAAVALSLLSATSHARADAVYVLNSAEASVSILDAATREEIRRLPVLREPHHLALTPDGSTLLIADSGGNELIFLDPASGEVKRRERISDPYHLGFSPDGKLLVVASLRRDQLDIYDAGSFELLRRLKVGAKPSHIAFSPDSNTAYVTLQGARRLLAIDLAERQPAWSVEVGPEPAGVTWHRGRLLVGIMGADYFAVVDPGARKVERTIPVGKGAHTVFPAPDGSALFATSRVDSKITDLDPETLQPRRIWPIPGGPDCIAFGPDGRLWITLRWTGRVAVLSPADGAVAQTRVGRSPHGIYVQPVAGITKPDSFKAPAP